MLAALPWLLALPRARASYVAALRSTRAMPDRTCPISEIANVSRKSHIIDLGHWLKSFFSSALKPLLVTSGVGGLDPLPIDSGFEARSSKRRVADRTLRREQLRWCCSRHAQSRYSYLVADPRWLLTPTGSPERGRCSEFRDPGRSW